MNLQVQILLLIIGQILTILAVVVTNYLNRRQNNKLLEDELQIRKRIEHLQEQLTQFYGPIYTLLSINNALLRVKFDPDTKTYTDKVPDDLWSDLNNNVITPNNLAIVEIIKSNFHLLEGAVIPPHFIAFILHSEVRARRYKHDFEKSEFLKAFPFPEDFREYIYRTTDKLKKEHDLLVSRSNRNSLIK